MRQLLPNLVGFVILTYAQLWMGKVRLLIFLQLWVKQHNLYQYIIISEHILLSKKTKNKKQIIQPIKTSVLTNFWQTSMNFQVTLIYFLKSITTLFMFFNNLERLILKQEKILGKEKCHYLEKKSQVWGRSSDVRVCIATTMSPAVRGIQVYPCWTTAYQELSPVSSLQPKYIKFPLSVICQF